MQYPLPFRLVNQWVRAGGLVAALAVYSLSFAQADAPPVPKLTRGMPVTLNFANAEIEAVARAMSSMTGRQVVVDPRVKGTITLTTDQPISPARAYNQFLAALRLQGFTVVESAGLDKVVPEADAKLQSGGVSVDGSGKGGAAGNQIVTQIFKLNFESAANLLPVLRPLISPNNVINVNPGNNSLIITDYADNLQRLARIIAASDVANGSDLEILPLKYAIASDLAPLILRLMDSGTAAAPAAGQTDSGFKTTIIAEPRSNALIVRAANPARISLVKSLVARLDQPTVQGDGGTGNVHVVMLKNADATKLAATLRAVISGEVRSSVATATSGGAAAAAPASATTGGQVQADVATNSLIITAPDPQYRQLRAVIDQLDGRRAQVFVESLIAEVNADRAAEFGIQWQGPIGKAGDSTIGLLGTNFGSGAKNIIALATGAAAGTVAPAAGLNIGAATLNNGVYTLGFLARFLEQNGDGNILSTPNLLTLDNEEAKIVIGQNVPFVTGQYTNANSGGTGSVNPFQTIERKDVGLTLRVKPQISENGTVKLSIFQEVSTVQASSVNSATGLITNKRSIESNVLVDDGSIVVLGGLLQDTYSGNNDRVPGLADIPFFGALFRSEARSRSKTNLMVFLRPVVIRDGYASDVLSNSRYDQMRGTQQDSQPLPSKVMPINGAAVLPEAPPIKPRAKASPATVQPLVAPASASPVQ
ncbi:type II secretion system protein GspD [Rhodoferax lacus]|uniref:Type II secretion system protein GspD n=1 Tax=Rhodoferax lacus TaxID=2184758 RepID=A0A3E1RE19_9BURK|nr:type II secretion system protein GspD [Rhodoferax lacus]